MSIELEHKQQLYELMCRYCSAVDSKDFDHLRSLYHPDAVHDHGEIFCGGIEPYLEFLRQAMQQMTTQHVIGNHLYHVDGATAVGEIYTVNYHVFYRDSGDIEYTAGGRYLDHYVCNDGRWLIMQRKRLIDWSKESVAASSTRATATHNHARENFLARF